MNVQALWIGVALVFLIHPAKAQDAVASAHDVQLSDLPKHLQLKLTISNAGSVLDKAGMTLGKYCPTCNVGEIPIGHPVVLGPTVEPVAPPTCPPGEKDCDISLFQLRQFQQFDSMVSDYLATKPTIADQKAVATAIEKHLAPENNGGIARGHPKALGN